MRGEEKVMEQTTLGKNGIAALGIQHNASVHSHPPKKSPDGITTINLNIRAINHSARILT